ncbi:unnamed protein product [Sympodiomycopsis kandeliae]
MCEIDAERYGREASVQTPAKATSTSRDLGCTGNWKIGFNASTNGASRNGIVWCCHGFMGLVIQDDEGYKNTEQNLNKRRDWWT